MNQPADGHAKDRLFPWMPLSFMLLIALGFGLIRYVDSEAVHSLGHALIIAGILGLTVDYYAKKHLIKEAARDIDKYLLGYALPTAMQDTIREVRDTKIVRRDWTCTYTISPHPERAQHIILATDFSFEAVNITHRRQLYTSELALDRYTSPTIELLSCESNDRLANYNLSGPALATLVNSYNAANADAATIAIKGRTTELEPKATYERLYYKYRVKYSQIYPDIGSDHFQFDLPAIPTIGVCIIVNHPSDFEIQFHSKPEEAGTTRAVWSDPKVFLRGEIITIWWQRKLATGES